MLERLLDDVRYGTRILTKAPGLSATAALLIALVVGGNATVFSMVNSLVRGKAPGVTATDLVSFGAVGRPGIPYHRGADYELYAAQTRTLRSLAAFGFSRRAVVTPNGSFLLDTIPVTANYFDTIGVRAARGRTFIAADGEAGAESVAVISDATWRQHFGADEAIVGQAITVNAVPMTVIGVTTAPFAGAVMSENSDLWVPLPRRVLDGGDVMMIGRLASAVALPQVRAEFDTLQARVRAALPRDDRAPLLITEYAAMAGGVLPAFQREILAIFSIVTLLTLLVVCANVANLMLARALARQRETAVRQSLGASRLRLVRLLLAEGLSISLVAGAAAFVVASWAASIVPRLLPVTNGTMNSPVDFTPDWRVAVYALVLTLIGTLIFSLAPALRTWRFDPLPSLKDGAQTATSGRSRAANGLVVLQIAFSVLLLTTAGLAYRSSTLMLVDVGFDPEPILAVSVGTPTTSRTESSELLERVRQRLATVANATAVSYTGETLGFFSRTTVGTPDVVEPIRVRHGVVGADYLEVLGLEPTAGRALTAQDGERTTPVAVINEQLAQALWAGRSPLGQTMVIGHAKDPVEIVGVMPDAFYGGFNPEHPDTKPNYVLLSKWPASARDPAGTVLMPTTFLIRHRGDVGSVSAAIPAALANIDARVALASRERLVTVFQRRSLSAQMIATLLGVFASLSLLIAAIGQYAVVAFRTRRRTRDFGIRIALGASGRQIVRSVLGQGAALTAIGLGVGMALSAAVASLLRGALFGVTPTDPQTYLAVFAVLACVSLFASYLPARRASRIDPVQALRQE